MKICYLVENIIPEHGGGRYARDLISAVKKEGHNVVVLEVNTILDAIKARKYCKNCDVIHAIDGYPYGIVAALANIGLNKKLIITAQGTYAVAPLYSFDTGWLLRWAYKKADKIIAISRYTKKEILKKLNTRYPILDTQELKIWETDGESRPGRWWGAGHGCCGHSDNGGRVRLVIRGSASLSDAVCGLRQTVQRRGGGRG